MDLYHLKEGASRDHHHRGRQRAAAGVSKGKVHRVDPKFTS
jgi:hypothetical protein